MEATNPTHHAAPPDNSFVLMAHPVPGDGNCLFTSVALIVLNWIDLRWAQGERAKEGTGAPAAPLEFVPPKPEEVHMLANYLRSRVAQRVVDVEDEDASRTMEHWFQLWVNALKEKDTEMAIEMRHMNGVEGVAAAGVEGPAAAEAPASSISFSMADRRVLFRNMMDARIYWGDEFALRSLEAILGCMLCVVNESYKIVKREYTSHPPATLARAAMLPPAALQAMGGGDTEGSVTPSRFLGLLVLRHNHYEPLRTRDGIYAWDMDALPTGLAELVNAWVGKV